MPVSDRTATIRGLELGDGTYYPFAQTWVSGLGIPAARTVDQPDGALSGDVGGDDVLPARVIILSGACDGIAYVEDNGGEVDAAANLLLEDLRTAWAPLGASEPTAGIELTIEWAGATDVYTGRPRGLDVDVSRVCDGVIRWQGTFAALKPWRAGEPIDVPIP